jgi:lipid-A-disaccharide synthase
MVAGEASGDLLASMLLAGLRTRWPRLEAAGIGGPKMGEQGFDAWWPSDKLAVRGYVEVLRHYREIAGIRRALGERIVRERPAAFIGVDAPDFNLGLEEKLRAQRIRTIHFVCPSIWAWRAKRIEQIRRAVDHMLCVFPFEPELLERHGVAATFVGHPLADAIALEPADPVAARVALGLDPARPTVALLPGSRRSEVEQHAQTWLQAARLMARDQRDLQFVLPVAPGLRPMIDAAVATYGQGLPLAVIDGRSHEALAACDVTLIASGTATLEAALLERPMVIAYRMNAISYQLMKRMALLPWIGLPNILARESLVPERVQHDATPEQLAADVLAWLDDPGRTASLRARFTEMHHQLRRDTARTATDAIEAILAR